MDNLPCEMIDEIIAENLKSTIIEIYTDGACKGNPGRGGWGAILKHKNNIKEIYGGERSTTNNQMELTAVIKGLEALKTECNVVVYSDSNYVVKGMNEWIHGWKKKNWISSQKTPVKNKELWQKLDELCSIHNVRFKWIKAHNGHPDNERADFLANLGIYEQ